MKQNNYQCSITANVIVAKAIESINRVDKWWTENFEGSAEDLGDKFTVTFSGETFVDFEVVELIPGKKMTWLVTDCYLPWLADKKEWKGTNAVWELSGTNHTTTINFTHVGLVPQVECYESCVKGWDEYVKDSLLKLLTKGEGAPQKAKATV